MNLTSSLNFYLGPAEMTMNKVLIKGNPSKLRPSVLLRGGMSSDSYSTDANDDDDDDDNNNNNKESSPC